MKLWKSQAVLLLTIILPGFHHRSPAPFKDFTDQFMMITLKRKCPPVHVSITGQVVQLLQHWYQFQRMLKTVEGVPLPSVNFGK